MTRVVLLGPQRFHPTVAGVLDELDPARGRVAVVTAGWQERESEDEELRDHVGRDLVNLRLYERHEDVLARDPELAEALQDRQRALRRLQDLYRLRLGYGLSAVRELMQRDGRDRLVAEQRRAAIRAVRTLDRQHLARIRRLHASFDQRMRVEDRPLVRRHREELAQVLHGVAAVCVAGGHVAVLNNRLKVFRLIDLLEGRPLVAWSAGAMVVTERIVLFHDSPPQGAGNAEVLDSGLGACPGVVALPHASTRLRLDDPMRVATLARRFSPSICLALDPRQRVEWDGSDWRPSTGLQMLAPRGAVREFVAS